MPGENSACKIIVDNPNPDRNACCSRGTVSVIPEYELPIEIANDPELMAIMSAFPENLNFQIPKTIERLKNYNSQAVALQFPVDLLKFSIGICDIFEKSCRVETFIICDENSEACDADDVTARALGADFLVQYGHSLSPVDKTYNINMLYVCVEIQFDAHNAVHIIEMNFDKAVTLALISTTEYVSTLQQIASDLQSHGYTVEIPRCRPLAPGEVIECTSPEIESSDVMIFIGDSRFPLEAVMMENPRKKCFRYNPFTKTLREEEYDYEKVLNIRRTELERAANSRAFGIIVGALAYKGTSKVRGIIEELLKKNNKYHITFVMSSVFPEKLKLFSRVDAWVQIACPRLSVDELTAFAQPLLTPYEAVVAFKDIH